MHFSICMSNYSSMKIIYKIAIAIKQQVAQAFSQIGQGIIYKAQCLRKVNKPKYYQGVV